MKKRIFGMIVILVGVLLIVVSLLMPLSILTKATTDTPIAIIGGAEEGAPSIGIIGGADGPTYIYLYSSFGGGIWMALTALGVLALISGLITVIADHTRKKHT